MLANAYGIFICVAGVVGIIWILWRDAQRRQGSPRGGRRPRVLRRARPLAGRDARGGAGRARASPPRRARRRRSARRRPTAWSSAAPGAAVARAPRELASGRLRPLSLRRLRCASAMAAASGVVPAAPRRRRCGAACRRCGACGPSRGRGRSRSGSSSTAMLTMPPALATKSGAQRMSRSRSRSATSAAASWLLAAPAIAGVCSRGTLSWSRTPPSAHGHEDVDGGGHRLGRRRPARAELLGLGALGRVDVGDEQLRAGLGQQLGDAQPDVAEADDRDRAPAQRRRSRTRARAVASIAWTHAERGEGARVAAAARAPREAADVRRGLGDDGHVARRGADVLGGDVACRRGARRSRRSPAARRGGAGRPAARRAPGRSRPCRRRAAGRRPPTCRSCPRDSRSASRIAARLSS